MSNYKYILAAGTALFIPNSTFADTCATLPDCASLGFKFAASECGSLKKLKCPFGDQYFCSISNCKAVTVGYNMKCTKYCEDDNTVCVEAEYTSCSAAISAKGGRMISAGTTSLGTITQDLYLMGAVETKYQSGSYNQQSFNGTQKGIHIYDAGKVFPICKKEMGNKEASLNLHSLSGKGSITFHVPTTIKSLSDGGTSRLYFEKDANLTVQGSVYDHNYNINTMTIGLYGYNSYNENPYKYDIKLYCTDSMHSSEDCSNSGNCQKYCNVNIEGLDYLEDVNPETKICVQADMTLGTSSIGWNQSYLTPPSIDCDSNDGYYYDSSKYYENCNGIVTIGCW